MSPLYSLDRMTFSRRYSLAGTGPRMPGSEIRILLLQYNLTIFGPLFWAATACPAAQLLSVYLPLMCLKLLEHWSTHVGVERNSISRHYSITSRTRLHLGSGSSRHHLCLLAAQNAARHRRLSATTIFSFNVSLPTKITFISQSCSIPTLKRDTLLCTRRYHNFTAAGGDKRRRRKPTLSLVV